MESFAAILNILSIIVAKLSTLDACRNPGYTSGNSKTWTKGNMKSLQHAKSAKWEECKTKTLQRAKFQHEIWQYIKECNTNESATWKYFYTKKSNMEMVQYEKIAAWKERNMKNINCHSKLRKKCTIIHKRTVRWWTVIHRYNTCG